jgi:hypothetical protein
MKTIITTTSDKNRIGLYSLLLFTLLLTACTKSEYKIIVPNGYIGKVCLIKSNVTSNILTLDSNGIGYINDDMHLQSMMLQEKIYCQTV